ncbi:MAG: MarR family transcriptional regulator [Corynebacterium sp.]|nr:MarR family transcriptional regulator [Corynebacterium sp.]
MLAVHARFRGTSNHRAEYVQRSAEALSTLPEVGAFEFVGVEDIRTTVATAEALCDVVMALLADGSWAIGIGIALGDAPAAASNALTNRARAGQVYVQQSGDCYPELSTKVAKTKARTTAENISAAFALLGYVLNKRTPEGREATALVRSGLNQNEAAAKLDISKQAMSQRLQAAGWSAETAGWQLAVNLLSDASST